LSERSLLDSGHRVVLPGTLRAELVAPPPIPTRPWYRSLAPAYLAIFVWGPFFDSLWVRGLQSAGLPYLAAIAVVGSLVCFLFFYLPAATWGCRTRRSLPILAASTFGIQGSEWLSGLAIAAGAIVWYAAAIDFAIDATMLGLIECGVVAPSAAGLWNLGPFALRNPVFLCTAVFWIFITGVASLLRLVGVVGALMRVYAPAAFVLLAATALWLLPGLRDYRPEHVAALAGQTGPCAGAGAFPSAIALITGFFAMVGPLSVDWGTAARSSRDVYKGGIAGIVLAASSTATLALVVTAGAVGRLGREGRLFEAIVGDPPPLSFRWAVWRGIGGIPAAVILLLFGLAALAPACSCAWIFSRRLAAHWPGIRRFTWTWLGGAVAFLLIATRQASRLEAIDLAIGWFFAPLAGAMAGDFLRQRGGWAGLRAGVHVPGVLAWAVGLAIRPAVGIAADWWPSLSQAGGWLAQPLAGFLVAATVYWLATTLGRKRPFIPISELATSRGPDDSKPDAAGLPVQVAMTAGQSEPPPPDACPDRAT
jgi:hypothetical protein